MRGCGLCCACHSDPNIFALYQTDLSRATREGQREPTDAELDALIAERRATMPGDKNHKRKQVKASAWRVPVFVVTQRHNGRMLSAKVI